MTEGKYIEDRITDAVRRFTGWLGRVLDGEQSEDDREWDEFLDRLVAIREGKSPSYDGEWIPCEYRQPPKRGTYLTTTRRGAVRVNHYYGQGWGYKGDAVAWRPMPEAWKGAKDIGGESK